MASLLLPWPPLSLFLTAVTPDTLVRSWVFSTLNPARPSCFIQSKILHSSMTCLPPSSATPLPSLSALQLHWPLGLALDVPGLKCPTYWWPRGFLPPSKCLFKRLLWPCLYKTAPILYKTAPLPNHSLPPYLATLSLFPIKHFMYVFFFKKIFLVIYLLPWVLIVAHETFVVACRI